MSDRPDPATLAARAGLGAPGAGGEGVDLVAPLSLASVRAYADLAALDQGMDSRDVYRRYGPASVALLERAVASLEQVDDEPLLARATASGQAALGLALALLASPGRRRVVVVRPCYGGTDALVAGPLGNLGLGLTLVDLPPDGYTDHGALVGAALGADVCAVVLEVIANPLMVVVDVPAVTAVCRAAGVATVVDATFATPFLFRGFAHGADVVFHSLTKHLSGHSDVLGGILLLREEHPAAGYLDGFSRLFGAVLAPFDAWLALRGLRTAALRVERSSENAEALAVFFAGRDEVASVHYPGMGGAADAERCARLLPGGRGPMLSLTLRGGRAAADALVRGLEGVRLAPSLGDVATTVSHPALSSHRGLSAQQRAVLGISDGLVRVSVGIERVDDLRDEFAAALG